MERGVLGEKSLVKNAKNKTLKSTMDIISQALYISTYKFGRYGIPPSNYYYLSIGNNRKNELRHINYEC